MTTLTAPVFVDAEPTPCEVLDGLLSHLAPALAAIVLRDFQEAHAEAATDAERAEVVRLYISVAARHISRQDHDRR